MSEKDLKNLECDDQELENVAGGKITVYEMGIHGTSIQSDCVCGMVGGGVADKYQKGCACVLGGAGELTDAGKAMAKEKGKEGKTTAMVCAMVGVSGN